MVHGKFVGEEFCLTIIAYPLGNFVLPPLRFPRLLGLPLFPGNMLLVFFYMNPFRHDNYPLLRLLYSRTMVNNCWIIVDYFTKKREG